MADKYKTHDANFDDENRPIPPKIEGVKEVKIGKGKHKIPDSAEIVEMPAFMGNQELNPIYLQVGPTHPLPGGHPGNVFAVYAHNSAWHRASRDEWFTMADQAIERWAAINGKRLHRIVTEGTMQFNRSGEYE